MQLRIVNSVNQRYPFSVKRWSHVDFLLLYMVVVWGSIFTVVKLVTQDLPLNAVNALRFVLVSIIFISILLVKRDLRLSAKEAVMVGLLGVVGYGAYQLLSSFGISQAVVAGSALILATTPIFTTLFCGLFRVERVLVEGWAGIATGFVGISVIIVGEHGLGALLLENVMGEFALIISAACWALGAVVSKPLMRHHSAIKISAYGTIVGSVLYLPFLWSDFISVNWADSKISAVLLIVYWVVAGGLLGQLVRYYGVKKIGPHRASAYIYLVPFSAGLIAAVAIGSPVGIHHLIGGAVIFVGIALTRIRPHPETGKPPAGAP